MANITIRIVRYDEHMIQQSYGLAVRRGFSHGIIVPAKRTLNARVNSLRHARKTIGRTERNTHHCILFAWVLFAGRRVRESRERFRVRRNLRCLAVHNDARQNQSAHQSTLCIHDRCVFLVRGVDGNQILRGCCGCVCVFGRATKCLNEIKSHSN